MNRARRVAGSLGLAGFPDQLVPIALGEAVSSVGNGLWFTVWALYLTHEVGLSLGQVGFAMSVAGAAGIAAPLPLGRLADRRGPRRVLRALLVTEAAAGLGFAVCSGVWQVTLVASVVAACAQGGVGVSAAMITGLAAGEERIENLARMRACSHAGQAVGAALGGVVIAVDSRAGYVAAIVLNAATFLLYVAQLGRVPSVAAGPGGLGRLRAGALADVPFATLAGICGVLCLCWGLMSTGLPLWIAGDTRAPRSLAAVIVFASTVAIALWQTVFSRGYRTPTAASRAALSSGLALAGCCVLLALAAAPGPVVAAGLLLAAGAAHCLGELWFVAASRGFSVPLMDPRRAAEYQSVFAAGEAAAIMLAPALMTALVIPNHAAGWCGLALLFVLAAVAARPATRWAIASRLTD